MIIKDLKKMPKLFTAAQELRKRYDERIDEGIDDHITKILDLAWLKATKQIIDIGKTVPFLPTCEEMDMAVEMYYDKMSEYKVYSLAADAAIQEYL